MRIRTHLLLTNILVALGLSAVTILSIVSERTISKYNELAFMGMSLKSDFLGFNSKGKDLLSTSNLKDSLGVWTEAYRTFSENYDAFVKAPLLIRLMASSETHNKVELFNFLWDATKTQLDGMQSVCLALIERHGKGASNVQGLLYGYEAYGDMDFISVIATVSRFSNTVDTYLIPQLEELLMAANTAVSDARAFMLRMNITVGLAITFASILLILAISRSLHRRISGMEASMGFLKDKDYTVRVDVRGKDELAEMGLLLNGFVDDLSSLIGGVKRLSAEAAQLRNETAGAMVESSAAVHQMTANIVSISAQIKGFVQKLQGYDQTMHEISGGIDSLDGSIKNQAAFVERSTSSIEEMNASIGNVASIADQRVAASNQLVTVIKSGGAMLDETNQTILRISKDMEEIGEIVGIINGIAEQTNILSMNAAIEAAHAGSAGRGFSVVADEIRKLADSTDTNAKQVSDMIAGIAQRISAVRSQSDSSKATFAEVDAEANSTNEALHEVSLSMKELAQGSKDIMGSMLELSGIALAVEKDTTLMKERASRVSEGMHDLENNSAMVMNGIVEIESGTKEINYALEHVDEMQARSGESMELLLQKISAFKTEA